MELDTASNFPFDRLATKQAANNRRHRGRESSWAASPFRPSDDVDRPEEWAAAHSADGRRETTGGDLPFEGSTRDTSRS